MEKRQLIAHLIVLIAASVLNLTVGAASIRAADYRVQKLANFFVSQNSPLVHYASDFVHYADQNGIDYRLLPAISGVESTFAKNYIQGTYNAYGWGQGTIPFTSWPDGIAKITAAIRANYVNRGATTVEEIGKIYCPPCQNRWPSGVHQFMNQIENTRLFPNPAVSFALLPLSI